MGLLLVKKRQTFRVWGSGFGVQGLGFRVWGLGFGLRGFRLLVRF